MKDVNSVLLQNRANINESCRARWENEIIGSELAQSSTSKLQ